MSPSPSKPIPSSPSLPRSPPHILLAKHQGNEKMWCEWCNSNPCRNIEYEEEVMGSFSYLVFLRSTWDKYNSNLRSEVPDDCYDLSPKRFVQKIRFWNYERYANHFSLPWGKGDYSVLPRCIKSKLRMTFRQPARDLSEWVKEPFLYSSQDRVVLESELVTGDNSRTILGKRKTD